MALIDKDKALDAIAMYLFVNDAIRGGVKVADYKVFAETILKDVPVVDAIPRDYYEKVVSEMAKRNVEAADIVRCKECKHWDDRRDDAWWSQDGACLRTTRLGDATYTKPDDYCSYGERRE